MTRNAAVPTCARAWIGARLPAACLLAIAVPLAAAFPQNITRPGRPATDVPFDFIAARGRLPGARPAAPSPNYRKYLPVWLEMIEKHQPGEADAAARLVSDWPQDALVDVVLASERDPKGTQAEKLKYWHMLERAVLLHTDIATSMMSTMAAATTPDVAWVASKPALHFGVALELVDWLRGQTREEEAFARGWYRTTAAFLVSQYEITSTPVFMERAMTHFRGDPDLLLMAGAVHELLASPRIQEGSDLEGVSKCGSAEDNLIYAEQLYRAALRVNASFTEARVRLGHVIGLRGDHRQALAELQRAMGGSVPQEIQYFLHLFIGEEQDALNNVDAARTAYRRALALRPHVQAAYLALSRLERRSGDKSSAIEAVQKMLQVSEEEPSDWLSDYYAPGLARRADALLEEFRTPYRRQQ